MLYGHCCKFHCIHKNIHDVQTRFDTWKYELDIPLPKVKIKVIRLMKDKLG